MTIGDLKRALLEVRGMCAKTDCIKCVFSKRDEANVPFCPLIEDEDGFELHEPAEWDIREWMEDTE